MYTAFENFEDQLDEVYNERTRTKTFGNRTYVIRCTDPYGFWKVESKSNGGAMPEVLKQNFTTIELAWGAVENYEREHSDRLDKREEKKAKRKPQEIEL